MKDKEGLDASEIERIEDRAYPSISVSTEGKRKDTEKKKLQASIAN
jgi:hypothetical protein